MSRTLERYQNPTCGDTVNLRLFTYNSNNRRDVKSIDSVEIYADDGTPDGRLVKTISSSSIIKEATGQYLVQLELSDPLFVIGKYRDVWSAVFEDGECAAAKITNDFDVYSDLWFTTSIPPVYDFNFNFRPGKMRKGTKKYLIIEVIPNVPRGSDLASYYQNLAVVADLKVSLEMSCTPCMPAEQDLRLLVDNADVNYREKGFAYYFMDTTLYDEGIYNIWFQLSFGENVFVGDKNAFQIFN